jgi:hypothetical protein
VTTAAAALIRADIRAAVEDGVLGVLPDGISFSVRASTLASGPRVRIAVYGAGAYSAGGRAVTPAGAALSRELTEIAGRRIRDEVTPDGFAAVEFVGLIPPDEETTQLVGPPTARGDIPGHPKRKGAGTS